MRSRSLSVVVTALALVFTACPVTPTPEDAGPGFDAGNPPAKAACSGGCAEGQICDAELRTCVSACTNPTCGNNSQCRETSPGVHECVENRFECGGNLCEPGETTCRAGACACQVSLTGGSDTCQINGEWCRNGACESPVQLEQCVVGSTTARCPTGWTCNDQLFGGGTGVCLRTCTNENQCNRGEVCSSIGCLPARLFGADYACDQHVADGDGGLVLAELADGGVGGPIRRIVAAGNTCLVKSFSNGAAVVTDAPGQGTGNCGYSFFRLWARGNYAYEICLPPGTANLNERCALDTSLGTVATQCNTGLTCVPTHQGNEGLCRKTCNAQPPAFGYAQTPACNADEACVNYHRYQDPNSNSVLGACMKRCNVFSADAGTCADEGTTPASCVPTQATGELTLTLDGEGVCIPQHATTATLGQPCDEVDPFRGATCASGQMCTSAGDGNAEARCTAVCDLTCSPTDGGTAPASCATRPNATCAGGKTCTRVTSSTGAFVGFCL